jgi:hypothetical protein
MEAKPRPRLQYLDMPKDIGAVSVADLMATVRHHRVLSEKAVNPYEKAENDKIAGHALAEAMLIYNDPDQLHTAYRLEQLDSARALLAVAADAEYAKLEAGHNNPDDIADWIRTRLAVDFIDVYDSIVNGEITNKTRRKITVDLQRYLNNIDRVHKKPDVSHLALRHLNGVRAEILVLLEAWNEYTAAGDPIAIPATYRGGHGETKPRDTHDVVLLRQTDRTTFFITEQIEVKTQDSLRRNPGALGRYAASLRVVSPSGAIKNIA